MELQIEDLLEEFELIEAWAAWLVIEAARGRSFAIDPATTSNPGARGEDSPLAVLA